MAIRYVKDFEFPSAAGFTSSAPSKVTGQMLAKGGQPKGLMVVIGVGKPKGAMKKADGGGVVTDYDIRDPVDRIPSDAGRGALEGGKLGAISDRERRMMQRRRQPGEGAISDSERRAMQQTETPYKKGGKVEKVMHEFGKGKLHSGSKKGPKVTNPKQAVAIALSEAGKSKKGYAEGGMKAEQGVALPSPEKEMFEVYDRQSGDVVGTYGSLKRASRAVDRRDNEYGGSRYSHRPVSKAKGGMAHEDAAEDRAMIKSMVKPMALKKKDGGVAARPFGAGARDSAPSIASTQYKAMGGQAVQMAKSNAIAESLKGQKKTPYADGGMALAPPRLASPLQAMGARPRGVPVAPPAPMIPQQAAAPAGGPRIGVGRSRSGKPDVGAIRAAMARAATQAAPENSPGMMKKGGKVKC